MGFKKRIWRERGYVPRSESFKETLRWVRDGMTKYRELEKGWAGLGSKGINYGDGPLVKFRQVSITIEDLPEDGES